MLSCFFIFGRHPSLSAAELINYFINNSVKYEIKFCGHDFIIVGLEKELKNINESLGGVVKFGQAFNEFDNLPSVADLQSVLQSYINQDKKFYCGFSYYPTAGAKAKKPALFRLGLSLKNELKVVGQKVRLVDSREVNLSSVVVSKNKLLSDNGAEIILLQVKDKLLVGRTQAVQDFEDLGFRDYSRPRRDDRSGMLPPKLAQMMINIGGSKEDILLDPFCGSGTLLQEALLLGFNEVIGFDESNKAVNDTKQNLDWLRGKYNVNLTQVEVKQVDVRQLSGVLAGKQIDVIITEPDLGSPQIKANEVNAEKRRLEVLYLEAFAEFDKVLKAGGRIVMVWPVFFGKTYLDIEKKLTASGFKKVEVLAEELKRVYPLNYRDNLEYSRPGQKVGREITVWQK